METGRIRAACRCAAFAGGRGIRHEHAVHVALKPWSVGLAENYTIFGRVTAQRAFYAREPMCPH